MGRTWVDPYSLTQIVVATEFGRAKYAVGAFSLFPCDVSQLLSLVPTCASLPSVSFSMILKPWGTRKDSRNGPRQQAHMRSHCETRCMHRLSIVRKKVQDT